MIISSIFLNMFGSSLGGRYKSFHGRYLKGLVNLSGNSQKKIIYLKKEDIPMVTDFLKSRLTESEYNLYSFIDFDLEQQIHHNQIKEVKDVNGYLKDRCLEIQYGKLEWMLNHIDEDDYIWWVDAGLVGDHLFPKKYSETFENAKNIFNDEYFDKLKERVGEKLYFICGDRRRYYSHGAPKEIYFEKNYQNRYHPIGGFFGGHTKLMKDFINKTNNKINTILSDKLLYSEEMVIEITFSEYIDKCVYDDFTIWKHEDNKIYVEGDDKFKKEFLEIHRPFYCNFIESEMKRNSEIKND